MVLVSAFSAQENRVEVCRCGAIEFMEKPLDPVLFKQTIGRLINQPAREPTSTSGAAPSSASEPPGLVRKHSVSLRVCIC